jgi:predicted RNA binding protein with dsRBD fold (UPF0201 family)
MKNITEQLLKDAFIDLVDDGWIPRIGGEHYVVHTEGNGESGKTISQALKRFLDRTKVDQVECNKQIVIYISRSDNKILNFKEYKSFQSDFLGCLSNFCDEIGVDEDKVSVENEYGTYTITILQDVFSIKNITKFIIIQKIFNTTFNGKISIGLYDDGIKLNVNKHTKYIKDLSFIQDYKDTYEEAIEMVKKDFDIEEKDNSLYLHPKFEFIQNENI